MSSSFQQCPYILVPMETIMPGRDSLNPFTTPDQMTLRDVLEKIEADANLPVQRRRNICSSMRTLAKHANRDPVGIPAHAVYLRDLFKRLHPEQCGLTAKRIGNIKSDLLFALRRVGCIHQGHSYMAPFTPEWQELWDRAACANPLGRYLSRLMHFCGAIGVAPDEVDDTVSDRFLKALEEESFVRDPRKTHRDSCKLWNKAVGLVPGWPPHELSPPRYRKTYTYPWDTFPKDFRDEVEALFARWAVTNILDDQGPMKPLKPKTLSSRRYRLRQIASALVHQGTHIEDITYLAQLVEIDTAKSALTFFLDRNGGKTSSQIHGLAVIIKVIAKHWVGVDEGHLASLGDICRRLDPGNTGLTAKNRERLRQFDDSRNVGLLLDFPRRQVEAVRHRDRGLRGDAVAVQIALAVELLLMAPIRAENLVNLSIDRHIQRSRTGRDGIVHLVIPGAEVKNGEPLEFPLPKSTVALMDIYMKDYQHRLVDRPSPLLFPGRKGKPKTRELFGDQVSKHVFKATGLRVNLHLFRHIAAKLYLDRNPGGYEVCRRVLGHRSMETTTRFYAGMETAAASRHFDEEILKLRSELRGPGQPAP